MIPEHLEGGGQCSQRTAVDLARRQPVPQPPPPTHPGVQWFSMEACRGFGMPRPWDQPDGPKRHRPRKGSQISRPRRAEAALSTRPCSRGSGLARHHAVFFGRGECACHVGRRPPLSPVSPRAGTPKASEATPGVSLRSSRTDTPSTIVLTNDGRCSSGNLREWSSAGFWECQARPNAPDMAPSDDASYCLVLADRRFWRDMAR